MRRLQPNKGTPTFILLNAKAYQSLEPPQKPGRFKAIAMTDPKQHKPVPYRPWAVWLLRVLLIPIAAAAGGMLFGLYQFVVTGQLRTAGRSFGATSSTIAFADKPVWFTVFFLLQAAVAVAFVVATVALARLAFRKRPPGH